jgi:hypothetical protein
MGFSNQAKILRGAFVEFGISNPPLFVVFQFNPQEITRSRSAYTNVSPTARSAQGAQNLDFTKQVLPAPKSLIDFRNGQTITVEQETLRFDIRLDATDQLNDGDTLAEQFGVTPELSTLELMMLPKNQSLLGGAISALLGGKPNNFTFFDEARDPPIILFVWGRKKVLPVNINSMEIREEEFSTMLNTTRAVVSVSLEVIEGPNLPFLYTKAAKEASSLLNLANIRTSANTIVPK